jgi:uroporphyrinogen-III decarboxylase
MDTTITPKKLVRGAFEAADLPRLPFIPWVFTHAARLEQIPLKKMFSDPTQYTKCLQNARKLYGYDAIAGGFDATLELEICGRSVAWRGDYETPTSSPAPGLDFARFKDIDIESSSQTGRFGTVIESLRRINLVSGQSLALAAVVTGPLTLAAGLTGRDPAKEFAARPEAIKKDIEAAASLLLKVVQVYCQLELDVITVADRLLAGLPTEHLAWLEATLSPIVNTVRFYNAFSVLLPGEVSPDNLSSLIGLGFDGVVVAGIDPPTWNKIKAGRHCTLGKAVPSHILAATKSELQEYLTSNLSGGFEPGVFLTTDWEVPPDTPSENINLVMQSLLPGT